MRTVGRIMALNRQLYDDIPHRRTPRPKPEPAPHPYKATAPHEYWFIDGRQMDFALDSVKWWSLIMLDGYSRAMLAGTTAPTEASWVALMVLFYTPDELTRKFSRALFPRTTNPYGCVTLHSYHFYVEQGVPHTQVLLWVYGEQSRAVLDNVVLAEYHCRYDWRTRKVTEIRDGVFYPTRFASPQRMLLPLTPQESLILYRPTPPRRGAGKRLPRQQLLLFELVCPAASESA